MHGCAERVEIPPQNLDEFVRAHDADARLVGDDGFEDVLERGEERLGYAVRLGVLVIHAEHRPCHHGHLLFVFGRVLVLLGLEPGGRDARRARRARRRRRPPWRRLIRARERSAALCSAGARHVPVWLRRNVGVDSRERRHALERLGRRWRGEADDVLAERNRVEETLYYRVAIAVGPRCEHGAPGRERRAAAARRCTAGTDAPGAPEVLEAEELVAAICTQRAGVGEHALERRQLRRVGVAFCGRVGQRQRARWALESVSAAQQRAQRARAAERQDGQRRS